MYYNPWDQVHVATAEQACLKTIDFFKNNPPNTYVDWSFVRSEFGQDFDSSVVGANGDFFSGTCIMTHTNPQVGTGIFYMPFSVECLAGHIIVKKDSNTATCTSEGLNLTLTPAPNQKDPRPDPRPASTKDKIPASSTYELIAKVMEGSTPKAGVAVSFAVEVEPNTGGHDHHDTSRPKGLVNGALTASGKTEANGEIKVTFQASEFAGTHVVAAACDSCTNKSVTKNVDVKVPGLIELQGDYSPSAKYELIGNENPPGTNHKGNHFFAPEAKDALRDLFPIFTQYNWGIVGVNDSSLKWGGRFDIAGQWNNGHKEHREGKEVDISFYRPFETIDEDKRDKVYEHLKKTKGVGLPQVLWHEKDNPATPSYAHFHVYLLGQSFFRKTTY